MRKKYHPNISQRIRHIQEIARQHYEPGNYSKSYHQVWRNYVFPVYPCCYATFLKYISTRPSDLSTEPIPHQYTPEIVNKIRISQDIAKLHYKPGNHKTCYKAVWREHIQPYYPIDYGAFIKYMRVKPSELPE